MAEGTGVGGVTGDVRDMIQESTRERGYADAVPDGPAIDVMLSRVASDVDTAYKLAITLREKLVSILPSHETKSGVALDRVRLGSSPLLGRLDSIDDNVDAVSDVLRGLIDSVEL